MRRVFWLLLTLAACAPAAPDDGPKITRACVRSFPTTVDAWRSEVGELPASCAFLEDMYDVVLASAEDMPCDDPIGVNQVRTECWQPGVIYVNVELDEYERVEASVHGWTHALAECVYGDPDADHLRAKLGGVYGAETVELQAQTFAQIGACL